MMQLVNNNGTVLLERENPRAMRANTLTLRAKRLSHGIKKTVRPVLMSKEEFFSNVINKDGKLAEYVFPKTYDNVGFGLLGFRKSYKSTMNVTASSIDDTSIRLYLQGGKQHQWVTLHPNMFSKEYKESHPDKF